MKALTVVLAVALMATATPVWPPGAKTIPPRVPAPAAGAWSLQVTPPSVVFWMRKNCPPAQPSVALAK